MARRTFYNISIEEEALGSNPVADGNMEIQDVIQMEQAEDEVRQVSNELEEDVAELEEANEVIEEMSERAEEGRAILENNPEAITEETVQESQIALEAAMIRLGYPDHVRARYRISRESYVSSPREAFRISNEGITDWLKTAGEAVLKLLKKIWETAKTLGEKIIGLFAGKTKQLEALEAKLKNMEVNKDFKPDNEVYEKAYNLAPFYFLTGKGIERIDKDKDAFEISLTEMSNSIHPESTGADIAKAIQNITTNHPRAGKIVNWWKKNHKNSILVAAAAPLTLFTSKSRIIFISNTGNVDIENLNAPEYREGDKIEFGDINVYEHNIQIGFGIMGRYKKTCENLQNSIKKVETYVDKLVKDGYTKNDKTEQISDVTKQTFQFYKLLFPVLIQELSRDAIAGVKFIISITNLAIKSGYLINQKDVEVMDEKKNNRQLALPNKANK